MEITFNYAFVVYLSARPESHETSHKFAHTELLKDSFETYQFAIFRFDTEGLSWCRMLCVLCSVARDIPD